ncbi:MAG: hypothetical protein A3F67_10650 [Verrucomicrobia bacterium RIFCSPHIGHO2_12_FULL_41_10]|nr:MAG: hypothetical protein A3F67_10650 [Verrucomicrobia bacterium RIFCSPHIGHO2_12_FULL_41_10]
MKNFKSFILTNTLGTFLEYLDATLYAFFATIIAANFFPEKNPTTSHSCYGTCSIPLILLDHTA